MPLGALRRVDSAGLPSPLKPAPPAPAIVLMDGASAASALVEANAPMIAATRSTNRAIRHTPGLPAATWRPLRIVARPRGSVQPSRLPVCNGCYESLPSSRSTHGGAHGDERGLPGPDPDVRRR